MKTSNRCRMDVTDAELWMSSRGLRDITWTSNGGFKSPWWTSIGHPLEVFVPCGCSIYKYTCFYFKFFYDLVFILRILYSWIFFIIEWFCVFINYFFIIIIKSILASNKPCFYNVYDFNICTVLSIFVKSYGSYKINKYNNKYWDKFKLANIVIYKSSIWMIIFMTESKNLIRTI